MSHSVKKRTIHWNGFRALYNFNYKKELKKGLCSFYPTYRQDKRIAEEKKWDRRFLVHDRMGWFIIYRNDGKRFEINVYCAPFTDESSKNFMSNFKILYFFQTFYLITESAMHINVQPKLLNLEACNFVSKFSWVAFC